MTPARGSGDRGNAVVEFVFVALIAFVPLVYLIVAVAVVVHAKGAVAQAARDAGRAFATAATSESGRQRALVAAQLDMGNAGLNNDFELRFVSPTGTCSDAAVTAQLTPGARYLVCVSRRIAIPAVPSIVAGKGVTTVASFQLYVDDYRALG